MKFFETSPSLCDRRAAIFFHFFICICFVQIFLGCLNVSNFPFKIYNPRNFIFFKIKLFYEWKCWCFCCENIFFSSENLIDASQQSASVLCLKLSLAWFLILIPFLQFLKDEHRFTFKHRWNQEGRGGYTTGPRDNFFKIS